MQSVLGKNVCEFFFQKNSEANLWFAMQAARLATKAATKLHGECQMQKNESAQYAILIA